MSLEIEGLALRYGSSVWALGGVNLSVADGEILSVLGPSGSGKTTLLQILAGLLPPTEGTVRLGGQVLSRPGHAVAPEHRNIGLVFQDFALWPHMTVAETVAFPLSLRRMPREARQMRVSELLSLVRLDGLGGRYPHELSGGQRQRVAMARALAPHPEVVLLDEPMSNLDARLRERMRLEIVDALRHEGVTAVYVTHDRAEALCVADRVAIMNGGSLVQVDTPETVYRRPASAFAAGFLGDAALVPARVVAADRAKGVVEVQTGLGLDTACYASAAMCEVGREGAWVLRPEHVRIVESGDRDDGGVAWLGRVVRSTYAGSHWQVEVRSVQLPDVAIVTRTAHPFAPSTAVWLQADTSQAWFVATTEVPARDGAPAGGAQARPALAARNV